MSQDTHEPRACCGARARGPTKAALPPPADRSFRVSGLDCAEDVRRLSAVAGPKVGGAQRLAFDVLNGRMTLLGGAHHLGDEAVARLAASTGMGARPWDAAAPLRDQAAHLARQRRLARLGHDRGIPTPASEFPGRTPEARECPKGARPMLPIGALSRRTGTKVQTIRYYERIGLMRSPERSEGGQRRYHARDLDRLAFIRHARQLGFPLDTIRELLALADQPQRPCAEADSIARRQLDQVERRIARLKALETELRRMNRRVPRRERRRVPRDRGAARPRRMPDAASGDRRLSGP